MKHLPGHGLVIDQTALSRPDRAGKVNEAKGRRVDAVAQAEAWLAEQGLTAWEVADLDLGRRTRHAWWTDDGAGFVPASHPGARPVLVVDVPAPEETPAPRTPKEIPAP